MPGEVAAAVGICGTAGERQALVRKMIDDALWDLAGCQIVVQDKPPDETRDSDGTSPTALPN